MKAVIIIIALYFAYIPVFSQTNSKTGLKYKPKNLDEAVLQLEKLHHDTVKRNILSMTEDQFNGRSHFGMGTWIRNNWRLWGNGKFPKYFNSIGIFHPDDMSGIILTSYYRHLKGQDRELDKQVKYYQDYWRASEEHAQRLKTDTVYQRAYQQKIKFTLDSLEKEDLKKLAKRYK